MRAFALSIVVFSLISCACPQKSVAPPPPAPAASAEPVATPTPLATQGSSSSVPTQGGSDDGVRPPDASPSPSPTPSPTADTGKAGSQGTICREGGKCDAGLACVTYYGIAGPRGPQFTSCEIPCPEAKSKCPAGQQCITIADGPGRVCRP